MTEFGATPPLPPETETTHGPEDRVCGNCAYWRPTNGDDGRCAVRGEPPWPVTNRLDGCGEYVGRMRL